MTPAIAIVGMACEYPEARCPQDLWENVLSQRRAFRRLPAERLRLDDYLSTDRSAPDRTYATEAALITDYTFDRIRFRVAGSTFRTTDLSHWLALDVAARALADAGFVDGEGLPRDTTGVILGNTLTGEMVRANTMRLRWPYVRRVCHAALRQQGWETARTQTFLQELEAHYKAPFPPVGEETLAGGLSNTIAGRICNHFNLKGGGYTVDGACASSLLAIITACTGLLTGDLDVALAGGVDISLDPFELVGFAKAGALAADEMRVYDTRSAGFWPGEGCGVVVLMRHEDAITQQRPLYAVIRGWGISSDGSGGMTRPEVDGQLLAIQRAYRRAGFGIDTVTYFEGHGTGTQVGDATELQMLTRARGESTAAPAIIGSVKANIGHTKAAAGIAGVIKATLALHHELLPPTTGCEQPHALLSGATPALQVLPQGVVWPACRPLRAAVSAMGFGGINTHVVLEGATVTRRQPVPAHQSHLLTTAQDAEVIFLGAPDMPALQQQVEHLCTFARRVSRAELTDLAAHLASHLAGTTVRAALVVRSPAALAQGLETVRLWLAEGVAARLAPAAGVYLGTGSTAPRLGFLFPGQGAPAHRHGGLWRRRFSCVDDLYTTAALPHDQEEHTTALAQPAIVTASLAALRVLTALGLHGAVAVGHSLGELTALHWAGVFSETAVLRLATVRGQAMAALPGPDGSMASLQAGPQEVAILVKEEPVCIAAFNAPQQTIISGATNAVMAVVARAQAQGIQAVPLAVSHAFHSPLVAPAAAVLATHLAGEQVLAVQRPVASTVTGTLLTAETDLRALLCQQVTAPVRFTEALAAVVDEADLWLEVGPGHILSGLVRPSIAAPVLALDAGGPSVQGLLHAVSTAFVLGSPIQPTALFAERFTRPFDLAWQPSFFVNPCELAPQEATGERATEVEQERESEGETAETGQRQSSAGDVVELVRGLVAERAELPREAVRDDSGLLGDLHLNSITVAQIMAEAGRRLGLPGPMVGTEFATATVVAAAQALQELVRTGGGLAAGQAQRVPEGVDAWVRAFTVDLVAHPLARRARPGAVNAGEWQVLATPGHALAASLQTALYDAMPGRGVVVCLPSEVDESCLDVLFRGVNMALAEPAMSHFVLVHQDGGVAGLARTLALEAPYLTICVVDVPVQQAQATDWVVAEIGAAQGYVEAHYDAAGIRYESVLRVLSLPEDPGAVPLTAEDVLLVTGGGKGIAAECALALARDTGVRLLLLGRSQPEADAELRSNLARMAAAGVGYEYAVADVTDAAAVRLAVRTAESRFGPVTAVLHSAGTNVPQPLHSLDIAACQRTLAPKVHGLQHVLAAVDPERLRLLVAFGSLIARTGMRGEADYALANAWLAHAVERFHDAHPACRCLTLEWSVWSGVGMGERLGRIEALQREGISPISPDIGIAMLQRLLACQTLHGSVVIAGRFGTTPSLPMASAELPLQRFLEQPRVYYPGIELIADADVSVATDPYVQDHVFQGERLLPGVMGLEAMAQVAMALTGSVTAPVFESVQFAHPVVVPEHATVTVRLAALVRQPGQVEVVLRSSDTAFQVEHFRATCRFDLPPAGATQSPGAVQAVTLAQAMPMVGMHPERELYGRLFFHAGRFRRIQGYHRLHATECVAALNTAAPTAWFGSYLPDPLMLGDPAARDAALHAIQACIPQATLLPVGVERIVPGSTTATPQWVQAQERQRQGAVFVYDVSVLDSNLQVCEQWQGLRLHMVAGTAWHGPWVAPLLGPYVERRLPELVPGLAVSVVVHRDTNTIRQEQSTLAIQRALGAALPVWRRADGKPLVHDQRTVSAAHIPGVTLAVAGCGLLSCDLQQRVTQPPALWRDLLGSERFQLAELLLRQRPAEDFDTAATRLWATGECLKKAGLLPDTPVKLHSLHPDGWVVLTMGTLFVMTLATAMQDVDAHVVLAIAVGQDHARL